MGLGILGEAEAGIEVGNHHLVTADVLLKGTIDSLLQGNTFGGGDLLLGTLHGEEFGISFLLRAGARESLVGNLGNINTGKADSGGGSQSVNLVDALKRHTVVLARAGNEEEARIELLKENNALATETA